MKNICSRIGFGRALAALFTLTMALGFSGGAHAVIDHGNTIESVTTSSYSSNDGHGTSYSSTTATGSEHAGVFDGATGLSWIKATSLEEGQALGYRPATASEFSALMLGKGWAATPGSESEWALTKGFSYSTSSSSSGVFGSSDQTSSVVNRAPVSFAADASVTLPSAVYLYSSKLAVTLAWLDGGATHQVGALFDRIDTFSFCSSGGRSHLCNDSTYFSHDAVVADLQGLQSGANDSASHTTASNWSAALAGLPQTAQGPSLMYFMVAAIPEPGTQALMVLGMAGLMVVARTRRGH